MSIRDAKPLENIPPIAAGGVRDAQTPEYGLSVPLVLNLKTLQLTLDVRLVSELAVSSRKLANLVAAHGYTESVLDRARHGVYADNEPEWIEVEVNHPWVKDLRPLDL